MLRSCQKGGAVIPRVLLHSCIGHLEWEVVGLEEFLSCGVTFFYGRKTFHAVFVAFFRDVQTLRVCCIEEEKNGCDKSAQAQK